eukprot:TRINITY_DN5903_c0_g1_i8.p1 TRINITY_DN5903_c0_g1~~TRINITY_DN5903_c0_g1_i8.p1  ORF type:complete len:112 (-),score=29.58 TRINITY_DN5903_c0_g1_i8:30-365(-)
MVQLHQQYRESGFEILGFPCNQFGVISGQETKSPSEIRQFVTSKFGVEFPMMEKIEVNGSDTHPVLSLIHISEPTRLLSISYAVFCLKKKKKKPDNKKQKIRSKKRKKNKL